MKMTSLIAVLLLGASVAVAPAVAKTTVRNSHKLCVAAAKAVAPAPQSVRADTKETRSNDTHIFVKLKVKNSEGKVETVQCAVDRNTDGTTLTSES
jgi:hypothetical protein